LSGCPEARFLSAFENCFSPCRSLLFPSTMIKSDCSATFNLFVLHHQDLISHAWLPGLSIWGDRLRFFKRPYLSESDLRLRIIRQIILTMNLSLIF
jgi:hypothetical protein